MGLSKIRQGTESNTIQEMRPTLTKRVLYDSD